MVDNPNKLVPPANIGTAGDAIADLIKAEEGFAPKARYDVNAYRAGYGSDTVTLFDGTVQRVTKNTVVTRADADRDLARRIPEFIGILVRSIGQVAWNR